MGNSSGSKAPLPKTDEHGAAATKPTEEVTKQAAPKPAEHEVAAGEATAEHGAVATKPTEADTKEAASKPAATGEAVPDSSAPYADSTTEGSATCEDCDPAEVVTKEEEEVDRPFSLESLRAEVEDLRADPPAHVGRVGHLKVPTLLCEDDGKLVKPSGDGPWDLTVCVAAEAEEAPPGFTYCVCMRFDTDWPMQPPSVRFQCIIHHALVDDSNGMLLPFYRTLPRGEGKVLALRGVVKAVHDFLIDPLKSWGIPAGAAPARLTKSLKMNEDMNRQRLSTMRKFADQVKHPELFTAPPSWREEWFDPDFWRAQQENTPAAWRSILKEDLPGEVFSFRLFTDEFCDTLVEEIFNFYKSGLPARRPNSMNNYGIILNEIGLEPFIDRMQEALQPLGEMLWPGPGSMWDGQHCFIVRYREGEDLGLDMHTDDSDVTFNICLGLDFAGAGLQFCGIMGAPNHRRHTHTYQHAKGVCVCHLGRKRHGADDISRGERLNLILWNHSSTYRQSEEYTNPTYFQEEGSPDEVCVSYTHDRDYGVFKEYPKGKEHFKGRGWCPPKQFQYEGFVPDAETVSGG